MSLPQHSREFRQRRFLNWFPMGLTYAFLYMGRYNLTVAKNSLGELMTKEDFGVIFGTGTLIYAFSFLFNGPLIDRIGGKRGIVTSAIGSACANLLMGFYLMKVMAKGDPGSMRGVLSFLYALNMYFQSFGAVSIVKVNAHWFHVDERGGFSGIFGTMISSGIFLAFTVNGWVLKAADNYWPGQNMQWLVFFVPACLLAMAAVFEFFVLRDRPGQTGHADFDTGDASSGDDSDEPVPTLQLLKSILTNPIILTVAGIEFCTGVLRNGVMHWFPIYAKEVWVLPGDHLLVYGKWSHLWLVGVMFVVAAISGFLASRVKGSRRGALVIFGALAFLAPFVQGGWGGLLFISGVIGGNVAGWVSDMVFQSRRGPAAAGLYGMLALCMVGMFLTLSKPGNEVQWADAASGLQVGDQVSAIGGVEIAEGWSQVRHAVACWQPRCVDSTWDAEECVCTTREGVQASGALVAGGIPARLVRGGKTLELTLPDPKAEQRAGDRRKLQARPELPMSPWFLGIIVFLVSLSVIGTHGLLSGTATMDFGGRKGAATAVGIIDGFVYLGTAVESFALGYLTTRDWSYWPLFLFPFALLGFFLCTRIWNAKPGKSSH